MPQKNFDFSGYDSIFLSLALNSDRNDQTVINSIKRYGKEKAILSPIRDFHTQIYDAIASAKLWLYCGIKRTEDPNILILQIEARVPVKTNQNQFNFNASAWEQAFVMKNQTEMVKQLEKTIRIFLEQCLKENSQVTFYYLDLKRE